MMGTRFSTVGWTGCVCAAALAFYLVSQTVAAKRAELITVDRKIISTQREIAQLETEISTRGGMAQIENWNSRVYGLQAPGAEQFVNSTVQLVAMANPQPLPLDPAISPPHGPVQQASLTVEAPADPAIDKPAPVIAEAPDAAPAARPMLRQATYITPQRAAMAPDEGNIHKTSYSTVDLDAGDRPAIVKPVVKKAPAANVVAAKVVLKGEGKSAKVAAKDAKATKDVKLTKDKPVKEVSVKDAATPKPPKTARAATKMTALDDNWLAEATADPAAKRSHKGRP
jgi:hypothetical protein